MTEKDQKENIMLQNPVTRFNIALDAINSECFRFEKEAYNEKKKPAPSRVVIEYLEAQIGALMRLFQDLPLKGTADVDAVIDLFIFSSTRKASSARREILDS